MHSNNKSVILWLTEWMLANIGQFFTFFKTVSYYSIFFFTRWKYKWIRIILSLATLTLAYGVVLLKYTKYRWMKDQFLEKCFVAPVGERNAKFWYYQMSCKRLFTGMWVTPATWGNQLMWGNPPISFQVEHVCMTGGVIISEIIWTGGLPHLNGLRHLPTSM